MMTQEVLVSVRGMHTLDSASEEEIEVISAGKYYFRDGCHYVFYEEQVDDSGIIVKNRVTLKDGSLKVQKSGLTNTEMIFEKGKKHMSWYDTPLGHMLAGIAVSEMQVTQQEHLLDILVKYRLELNYEHIADCRIRIQVMSKDSGLFRLR